MVLGGDQEGYNHRLKVDLGCGNNNSNNNNIYNNNSNNSNNIM